MRKGGGGGSEWVTSPSMDLQKQHTIESRWRVIHSEGVRVIQLGNGWLLEMLYIIFQNAYLIFSEFSISSVLTSSTQIKTRVLKKTIFKHLQFTAFFFTPSQIQTIHNLGRVKGQNGKISGVRRSNNDTVLEMPSVQTLTGPEFRLKSKIHNI